MTGTDYQSLIDAETWAFIARSDASYPPDTAQMDIAGQRRVYNEMCRVFAQPYPPGVTAQDETIAGIPCRRYKGAKPAIVYFHGGGFVVGGLHSHDDLCAEIAARTGCEVVSVDYRLSPENPHPAAYDDACAAIQALAAEGAVILAGDSAGGNLAAAAAAGLRGQVAPLGQVLIYPGLGGERTSGSSLSHAQAPMLTLADVNFYAGIRHGGSEPGPDPTVAPLQATDFSGLPATFALAAECDPLADDAGAYAAAIRSAGGEATSLTAQGMVHGCLRARHQSSRAALAFDQICAALINFAQRSKP